MKILKSLALKKLKLNKVRTGVTIIGVILSTLLITSVTTIFSSFQVSMIENQKETEGNYHYEFIGVSKDEIDNIKNNKNVESLFIIKNLGESIIKDNNSHTANINIYELTNSAFNNLGISLTEGRLPVNNNEIIVSNRITNYTDVEIEVGKSLFINTNNGNTKEYIIVGKADIETVSLEIPSSNSNSIFTIISLLEEEESEESSESYNVYIRLKNLKDRLNTAGEILNLTDENISNLESIGNIVKAEEKISEIKDKKYDLFINSELLELEGGGYSDWTQEMIYAISLIVIILIIIISVFCIKNSFNISMTERIRDYGILKSIGATKKQIRKEILYEGFFIGLVGIPIGLILGTVGIWLVLKIIETSLSNSLFGMKFIFSTSPIYIVIAAVLSIIVIYLSEIGTIRKANKIAPIETIKENKDINILNKKYIKTPIIIKKFMGIGGDIAYKNLKRNKRQYKTATISIILTISVFITIMSFMNYANIAKEILFGNIEYDVQVYGDDIQGLKEISRDENIKTYSLLRMESADVINYEEYVTNESKLEGTSYPAPEFMLIVSLGEDEYERYIDKLGLEYEDVKDKAILYDYKTRTILEEGKDKYLIYRVYNYKDGDIIDVEIYSATEEETTEYNIEISKVTDIQPMYLVDSNISYLIVSDEYWDSISTSDTVGEGVLSIVCDSPEELTEYIQENYKGYYNNVVNIDESEKETKAQITTIVSFTYIFIIVIILIGLTNIFNTITTNLMLRRREISTIKAIGMTNKEFKKMIRLETIFYSVKSLMFAIPIGLILSYLIYKGFSINFIGIEFTFPILSIVISIISVFILITIIMRYSMNKINNQNIIETIRNENI